MKGSTIALIAGGAVLLLATKRPTGQPYGAALFPNLWKQPGGTVSPYGIASPYGRPGYPGYAAPSPYLAAGEQLLPLLTQSFRQQPTGGNSNNWIPAPTTYPGISSLTPNVFGAAGAQTPGGFPVGISPWGGGSPAVAPTNVV